MKDLHLSWTTVSSERIADCKVFSVTEKKSTQTTGHKEGVHNFYVLHPDTWVNVIPVTDDGHVVMVEQFRHGLERVTLEIPGGSVDRSDRSSAVAAQRELLEETGYVSDNWLLIGSNHPNPAIQSNICDTYLARGVRQIEKPTFAGSGTELIAIRLVPIRDIPVLIKSGIITHALVIVAFYFLQLSEEGRALLA